MARWIQQTLSINSRAIIVISEHSVWIGGAGKLENGEAVFEPKDLADAQAMSLALRMAAKRLEDIGKGLANA